MNGFERANYRTHDTPQKIFDAVVRRGLDGRGQCTTLTGNCAYRSADGSNACFVGVFMDDGSPMCRSSNGVLDLDKNAGAAPAFLAWIKRHGLLLVDLQEMHDDRHNWDDERERIEIHALSHIAGKYGLVLNLPNTED
jgi:hypothetical protein